MDGERQATVGAHLVRVHPGFDQGIQCAVYHRRLTTGIDVHGLEVGDVLTHCFMQQPATPVPAAQVADNFVQEQVGQSQPLVPVLDGVEIFRATYAPETDAPGA